MPLDVTVALLTVVYMDFDTLRTFSNHHKRVGTEAEVDVWISSVFVWRPTQAAGLLAVK